MSNAPSASREWFITINNPIDHGFPHDVIISVITSQKMLYYAISDEIGEKGTYHTHIYGVWINPMRFDSLIKKFNHKANVQPPIDNATPEDRRNYIFKEGKYKDSEKNHTNLPDTHVEWGILPEKQQGKRNDLDTLYSLIKDGATDKQLLDANGSWLRYLDRFDKIRNLLILDDVKDRWRDLTVTYIYGETGTGKTRSIMEKYGYSNVYRVTDYKNPFDGYKGQDIILFEEFRSSLKIDDMLKYLDGYPVELSCRYCNQHARFTKVFFCTNIDLFSQYPNIQREENETWKAFLRRIDFVSVYSKNEMFIIDTDLYVKGFHKFFKSPFDYPDEFNWIQLDTDSWIAV